MAAVAAVAGLRELVMDKCLGVMDRLAGSTKNTHVLTRRREECELSVISCSGVTVGEGLCFSRRLRRLLKLKVSNESLRSLSTFEKLEDITMVCCLFTDDDGLQMLSAGNSLKEHY
ncbi:unnamed protein product [Miscanthus lutarioriparius]|uniref:Uncharacterized protein n=1 Tax=Miscanthus lutarioriparius TaxID=422564 RepID=A0A811PRS4_9POAL|nr:unnamed protein product [Miscanthus lutarioriparius]